MTLAKVSPATATEEDEHTGAHPPSQMMFILVLNLPLKMSVVCILFWPSLLSMISAGGYAGWKGEHSMLSGSSVFVVVVVVVVVFPPA